MVALQPVDVDDGLDAGHGGFQGLELLRRRRDSQLSSLRGVAMATGSATARLAGPLRARVGVGSISRVDLCPRGCVQSTSVPADATNRPCIAPEAREAADTEE